MKCAKLVNFVGMLKILTIVYVTTQNLDVLRVKKDASKKVGGVLEAIQDVPKIISGKITMVIVCATAVDGGGK